MELLELTNSLRQVDGTFEEIIVPPTAVEIRGEELRIEGRAFNFGRDAHRRALGAATAPVEYVSKLSPPTQAAVLMEALERGDFGTQVSVAVRGENVFTVCSGDLIRLRRHEVLAAMIEALGENAHSLTPTRIGIESDTLDVEFATLRKSIDVRRGNTVQGGLHISHSTFGGQATLVEVFTFRCVCTNGMLHKTCSSQNGLGRTRKLPAHHTNGRELQMEQIRRLTAQAWDRLEPILAELQATRERKADVKGLLTGWLQRARISTNEMLPRLLEAWQQDGEESTQYGAINALTRVATHGENLSSRQRRVLASLAGLLAFSNAHICPRCFTVLSQGATRGEDT